MHLYVVTDHMLHKLCRVNKTIIHVQMLSWFLLFPWTGLSSCSSYRVQSSQFTWFIEMDVVVVHRGYSHLASIKKGAY